MTSSQVSVVLALKDFDSFQLEQQVQSLYSQINVNIQYVIQHCSANPIACYFYPAPAHVSISYDCYLDSGIYESWNLALARATSTHITFLGFDDYYLYPTSLVSILNCRVPLQHSITIPSTQSTIYRSGFLPSHLFIRIFRLIRGMPIPHSASIYSSDLLRKPFNPSYKIAGDFSHLLSYYQSASIYFTSNQLVSIGVNGISSRNSSFFNKCFKETVAIFARSKYFFVLPFYLLAYTFSFFIRLFLR